MPTKHGGCKPKRRNRSAKLDWFWSHFSACGLSKSIGGCDGSCLDPAKKLQLLQELSDYVAGHTPDKLAKKIRSAFKSNRPLLRKFRDPCFVCGGKAEARHHVIQIVNGGTNDPRNVVAICNGCHEAIHPWMSREPFNPDKLPMWHQARKATA